jgi:hypothetical protein
MVGLACRVHSEGIRSGHAKEERNPRELHCASVRELGQAPGATVAQTTAAVRATLAAGYDSANGCKVKQTHTLCLRNYIEMTCSDNCKMFESDVELCSEQLLSRSGQVRRGGRRGAFAICCRCCPVCLPACLPLT